MITINRLKPVKESVNANLSSSSLIKLLLAIVTLSYGSLTIIPFLTDRFGLGTTPQIAFASLIFSYLGVAALTLRNILAAKTAKISVAGRLLNLADWWGLFVVLIAFGVPFLYSLNQAAAFQGLPVGITADSVHHFTLADYIRVTHTIPVPGKVSFEVRSHLVEMINYPPAYHLVAAFLTEMTGLELAFSLFPLVAFLSAICNAGVGAITFSLLKPTPFRPVWALAASFSTFLVSNFYFDSFMHYDYYGQIAGQAALMLGFYFIVDYYSSGSISSLLLSVVASGILILAYTQWLPILWLGLIVSCSFRKGLFNKTSWRFKLPVLILSSASLAFLVGLFLLDRLDAKNSILPGFPGIVVEAPNFNFVILFPYVMLGLAGVLYAAIYGWNHWQISLTIKIPALVIGSLVILGLESFGWFFLANELDLFKFDTIALAADSGLYLLGGLAGIGLVVAFLRPGKGRMAVGLGAVVLLEGLAVIVIKPGSASSAYHLSKLYLVIVTLIGPVFCGVALEWVAEGLAFFLQKLKLFQKTTPTGDAEAAEQLSKDRVIFRKKSRSLLWGWLLNGLSLSIVVLLSIISFNLLVAGSPNRGHPYAQPDLIETTQVVKQEQLDPANIDLAVQGGIPAYFIQVGLLGQPRDKKATDYYYGERHSFDDWVYSADSSAYLITDQWHSVEKKYTIPNNLFEAVFVRNEAALIRHRADYKAELAGHKLLYLNFEGNLTNNVIAAKLEIAGLASDLSKLTPVLAVGPLQDAAAPLVIKPLFSRPLQLTNTDPDYTLHKINLKMRLKDGYSRGELDGLELAAEDFKLKTGQYSLWIQLWKDNGPVIQRKVQDFDFQEGNRLIPLAPPNTDEEAAILRYGQLVLQYPPSPAATVVNPTSLVFQRGDKQLIELTGWSLTQKNYQPGDMITLSQRYRVLSDLTEDYIIFVHFVDEKGAVVAQSDFRPGMGQYPTWLWHKGEEITFDQWVKIPGTIKPGALSLELGIYTEPGFNRLETWFYQPYLNRIWENSFNLKKVLSVGVQNSK